MLGAELEHGTGERRGRGRRRGLVGRSRVARRLGHHGRASRRARRRAGRRGKGRKGDAAAGRERRDRARSARRVVFHTPGADLDVRNAWRRTRRGAERRGRRHRRTRHDARASARGASTRGHASGEAARVRLNTLQPRPALFFQLFARGRSVISYESVRLEMIAPEKHKHKLGNFISEILSFPQDDW